MSEPMTQSDTIVQLRPWLLNWWISDERIDDSRSESFALRTEAGLIIIDPVTLTEQILTKLEPVQSIILTTQNHQRSAWRYRRVLGVPVYAPNGSQKMDEEADFYYGEDGPLPDGFTALPVKGFATGMSLIYGAEGETVAFCADLIYDDPDSTYRFPREPGYFNSEGGIHDARVLIEQDVDILCIGHGRTIIGGVNGILQQAIDEAGI
jgi:glyoxylase-like metal-dependent hydrolase (beta-lactamase superfamily II)